MPFTFFFAHYTLVHNNPSFKSLTSILNNNSWCYTLPFPVYLCLTAPPGGVASQCIAFGQCFVSSFPLPLCSSITSRKSPVVITRGSEGCTPHLSGCHCWLYFAHIFRFIVCLESLFVLHTRARTHTYTPIHFSVLSLLCTQYKCRLHYFLLSFGLVFLLHCLLYVPPLLNDNIPLLWIGNTTA